MEDFEKHMRTALNVWKQDTLQKLDVLSGRISLTDFDTVNGLYSRYRTAVDALTEDFLSNLGNMIMNHEAKVVVEHVENTPKESANT